MELPPELPDELHSAFHSLISSGERRSTQELVMGVKVHLRRAVKAAEDGVEFDQDLAQAIGQGLLTLLERPPKDALHASWVCGAVVYYVNFDDQDPDFEVGGFADDAKVYNAVVKGVGRGDLAIQL